MKQIKRKKLMTNTVTGVMGDTNLDNLLENVKRNPFSYCAEVYKKYAIRVSNPIIPGTNVKNVDDSEFLKECTMFKLATCDNYDSTLTGSVDEKTSKLLRIKIRNWLEDNSSTESEVVLANLFSMNLAANNIDETLDKVYAVPDENSLKDADTNNFNFKNILKNKKLYLTFFYNELILPKLLKYGYCVQLKNNKQDHINFKFADGATCNIKICNSVPDIEKELDTEVFSYQGLKTLKELFRAYQKTINTKSYLEYRIVDPIMIKSTDLDQYTCHFAFFKNPTKDSNPKIYAIKHMIEDL